MHLKALPAVADPSLTEVANSPNHGHATGIDSRMPDQAIARLQHTLDLATLSADRQSLDTLAEVAKGTGLLLPGKRIKLSSQCMRLVLSNHLLFTLVAFHHGIAGILGELGFLIADLLLSQLLLLSLLTLSRLLFRHFNNTIN